MAIKSDFISGSFSDTGESADSFRYAGQFNVSLSGFGTATVAVQRSFDNGSTWVTVESFTEDTERFAVSPQSDVLWRFNCTSHSSGTIVYRMSGQTSPLAI